MNGDLQSRIRTAIQAARHGDPISAYQVFYQVSEEHPAHVEAWLWRAITSQELRETLESLNRALELDPENSLARKLMYTASWNKLEGDPFLQYLRETDQLYLVQDAERQTLLVPKERAVPQTYPPSHPSPLSPVYRWLLYGLVAVPLGGVGAVVGSLIALFFTARISEEALTHENRKRLRLSVGFALLLALSGMVFSILFVLHL